jgi:hypothetical protein
MSQLNLKECLADGGTSVGIISAKQAVAYDGLRTKLLRDQQVLAVPNAR